MELGDWCLQLAIGCSLCCQADDVAGTFQVPQSSCRCWIVFLFGFHIFGDQECDLHGLIVIQPWIDRTFVGPVEVGLGELPGSADTFGDIIAGEFEMDATHD